MDAETDMLIEDFKRTLGVLAIPFVKQLIPQYSTMKEPTKKQKEKELLDEINNKRKELELQSNLTIINNKAHTDNQNHVKEKTNQLTDYEKILP